MNKQIIALEVVYDPYSDGFTDKVAPAEWDWVALTGEDDIRVIAAGPVEEVAE